MKSKNRPPQTHNKEGSAPHKALLHDIEREKNFHIRSLR